MKARMLGLFSGFPNRQFPAKVAQQLAETLYVRNLLVFVSAWPDEYEQNDCDACGMHGMFETWDLSFLQHAVIDGRTAAGEAKRLIREADCIFLMGGHATRQMQMINRLDIAEDIRQSESVILGVSAGSANMARRALDIWESHEPYDGLGLTDITLKAHVTMDEHALISTLMQISTLRQIPICAMADDSAIFLRQDSVCCIGEIYRICHGSIQSFVPEMLNQ